MAERKRDKLASLTKSWAGRTLKTGRMAASVGKLAATKVVGGTGNEEALGEHLLENLDAMKGLAMKVGQMVSYLDHSLPPATQKILRKLQKGGQPMAFEALAPEVEQALGIPVDEAFDRIDPEPLAAASIGQVHRAWQGEDALVVKIQYPGVAETFAVDLGNFRRLGGLATLGTALDVSGLATELAERLAEECDYAREARAQTGFRKLYRHDSRIVVPETLHDLSAEKVLTSSFEEGLDFYAFVASATQEEKNEAAKVLFEFSFRNIFQHALLHGDPHPGNFLFRDGQVVMLDFGCVRVFDEAFVEVWKNLAWCILEQRREDLPEATRATGFVPDLDSYDWDWHWDVMNYLYEPFMEPGFRYTHEYVARSYELLSMKNPNWRKTAMPPAWLLTNRLQWGLNSILALLEAEGDFATLYRECVSAPLKPAWPGFAPS